VLDRRIGDDGLELRPSDPANLEIDMLARYVARLAEFK